MLHITNEPYRPKINTDDELLYVSRTHLAQIEFTTACNFRCVYCAVAQPTWVSKDMDLDALSNVISQLKSRSIQVVNISGHGETTTIPNWHEYAIRLLDDDVNLIICSNFGKQFSKIEVDVLSRFHGITVSCDTADPVLFKKLRKGGDLRTLVYNMLMVKNKAESRGLIPRWTWSCVLTDATIWGFMDFVKLGHSLGVGAFCICNLATTPPIPGVMQVKHLSTLSKNKAIDAYDIIMRAKEYCDSKNVVLDVKAGLTDTLRRTIDG